MKLRINNKYFRWGLTAFLVIGASILFYYFVFHSANIKAGWNVIKNIMMPVVWGFAIAYILTPVLNWLERHFILPICDKFGWKDSKMRTSFVRFVGILITAILFVFIIYILFYMMLSQIIPSIENIVANFDYYVSNFTKWIDRVLEDNPDISAYFTDNINKMSNDLESWMNDLLPNTLELLKTVSKSVLNVLSFLWDFIIGFIISIYVLASKEKFAGQAKKMAYAIFETDTANHVIKDFRFTHGTFIGFLGGKIIDSIIIGILCFIGTTIIHTPYAALVSVIVGVTNVIPFFGPYLGAIPSAILIFIVTPTEPLNTLYFIIFILVLQQFDGNFLGPKILGNSTGLTGFWVIFSITLFGGLFGIVGMIIGVPVFAVIYAGIKSIINRMLVKKSMTTETKIYETLDYIDEEGNLYELTKHRKKEENALKSSDEAIDRMCDGEITHEKVTVKGVDDNSEKDNSRGE